MWSTAHNIEKKFHMNFGGLDIVRMFAGVVRCLVLLSISPDRPRGVWNPEKQEAPCYPGFLFSDIPASWKRDMRNPFVSHRTEVNVC
jgi:hypothetical protein